MLYSANYLTMKNYAMKNSTVLFLFVSATMLHTVGATQTITHCQNNGVFGISCQTELSPIEGMRQDSMRMNAEIEMQRRRAAATVQVDPFPLAAFGVTPNAPVAPAQRQQAGPNWAAQLNAIDAQAKEIRCKGRQNCK